MAFYAIIGRLIFRMWVKSRTHYVVTDARVLAFTKLFGTNVHASFLDEIFEIESAGSLGARETLWFGEIPWWMRLLGAGVLDSPAPLPGNPGPVAFYDIREAGRVRELVTNPELRN